MPTGYRLRSSDWRWAGPTRAIDVSTASSTCCGLTEQLGIPACAEVVCPQGSVRTGLLPAQPYAVVHAAPKYRYKQWTADGWRKLAGALRQRGLVVAAIGAASDRPYLDDVWRDGDVTRLDGALSWPELSALIRSARVYTGPDTAVTHLAAATGTPIVATLWPDGPAYLGAVAGRRARPAMGCGGNDPAAWQRLAGAESPAVPALPVGGLRTPARQP